MQTPVLPSDVPERFAKAAEELWSKIDVELGAEVTVDMVPAGDALNGRLPAIGFFRRNGRTHPITAKNPTQFLRIRSGKLFRSYTEKDDAAHISALEISGWRAKMEFGSSAKTKDDFPYAAALERGGKRYRARPHLARALKQFQTNVAHYAAEFKTALIHIIREKP